MYSEKDNLKFGRLISELRRKKGFSQRKFAQISGLSNSTVSRIENSETQNPDIETIKLLAVHLDYPAPELIKLIDFNIEVDSSKKHARLNFLHHPVRKIHGYSSVSNLVESEEEEKLKKYTKEQCIEAEACRSVALKGMRLITLRMEKNITQKELADSLGIDKTLISQYEGEIIKPDYATVQRLAEFFGVASDYLIDNPKKEVNNHEQKDLLKNTAADKGLTAKDLSREYLEIAEEIQNAGIEIADVKAFISMIKKYKS